MTTPGVVEYDYNCYDEDSIAGIVQTMLDNRWNPRRLCECFLSDDPKDTAVSSEFVRLSVQSGPFVDELRRFVDRVFPGHDMREFRRIIHGFVQTYLDKNPDFAIRNEDQCVKLASALLLLDTDLRYATVRPTFDRFSQHVGELAIPDDFLRECYTNVAATPLTTSARFQNKSTCIFL